MNSKDKPFVLLFINKSCLVTKKRCFDQYFHYAWLRATTMWEKWNADGSTGHLLEDVSYNHYALVPSVAGCTKTSWAIA